MVTARERHVEAARRGGRNSAIARFGDSSREGGGYAPEPRPPLPICQLPGCDRVIFRGDDQVDGFHVRCHGLAKERGL